MKGQISALTLGGMVLLAAEWAMAQEHPEKPTYAFEKCYAVAAAGKNDCFTSKNSCGGTAETDRDPDYWVYLPKGTCDKIAGGSLKPGA